MTGLAWVRTNLAGTWAVMLGRPQGLGLLDLSIEGFWRSFLVVIPMAPFVLLGLISQSMVPDEPPLSLTAGTLLAAGIALLADWTAFPAVFALLARPFGFGSRYIAFIVARNWASIVVLAIISPIYVLDILGVAPPGLISILVLAAFIASLRFSYVIARTALAVPLATALPIVILDFLISYAIWSSFDRLR